MEIERKFLIEPTQWNPPSKGRRIEQGYLSLAVERTVRVRVVDGRGTLTVKGATVGASREEFEYEIPVREARSLLDICHRPLIEKIRYRVRHAGLTWDVDQFFGENRGLILAEVELEREDQPVERPDWVGLEVTGDFRFQNVNLVRSPYGFWGQSPRPPGDAPDLTSTDGIIFDAIEFAARAHSGHFRKGSRVPYLIHPLEVAKVLIRCQCEVQVVTAGILHDTVEDTQVSLEMIRESFGSAVAELVDQVSEPDKRAPWRVRKTHTIEHIATAAVGALFIICADKLHNIRSIREDLEHYGPRVWSRFHKPKKDQQWYYRAVVEALRARSGAELLQALIEELHQAVENVFSIAS